MKVFLIKKACIPWLINFNLWENLNAIPKRFYLTGDMTNLYQFIQGSLEWPFSELLSVNASLGNQDKYIAFDIFLGRILIILYKMLINI